jgi:hypothetical protein
VIIFTVDTIVFELFGVDCQKYIHAALLKRSHMLRVNSLEELSKFCTFRYCVIISFNYNSEHENCALQIDQLKTISILKTMLSLEHFLEL